MSNRSKNDWKRVQHILQYLNNTIGYGIKFHRKQKVTLTSYSDSDFCGDTSGKSTTEYLIQLGTDTFYCKTQLQEHVTLSSTKAEVIALCALSKELSWIRRMAIAKANVR